MRNANLTLAVGLVLLMTASTFGGNAEAQETIKPYILLVVDTSGSMTSNSTGNGAPSCGGVDTRFDHAKCAIQNLVNTHGDADFGLARFSHATSGSCSSCGNGGIDCSACNETTGNNCTAVMSSADRFELIVPVIDDAYASVLPWVDFTCGDCTFDPADNPELDTSGWTPIGGTLRGARRYFQGSDPDYTSAMQPIYGAAAGQPIHNDPLNDFFIGGEQCRPYVVIMLTDGEETCEIFDPAPAGLGGGGTYDAAANLLSTPVTIGAGTNNYRIITRPIGFGRNPGDPQIEGLAHAGGAPDVGGEFEGFYANSEEELSIAFNQIIADSLRVEVCNNIDDDCDGLVDEGFQKWCDEDGGEPNAVFCNPIPDDCDDTDDNCVAGTTDEPKNACGTCGPLLEECNLMDDDCDGSIDEGGVCGDCTPTGPELCNNLDDDCDGSIDESLTRPCGTNVGECVEGEETCITGDWENCTATGGTAEECDGLDNDCDGVIDGFSQICIELPGNTEMGVCQAGTEVCPSDGSGQFDDCLGEIGPSPEACDGLDNDCDGILDEGTGGADCSSQCGIGTIICVNGMPECDSQMTPMDEICNNLDDDCDGVTDEMVPEGDDCDPDGDLCEPGMTACIGGVYECVGGVEPGAEICDCNDNDCDTQVDEGALCGAGSSCVNCQCAQPCGTGEFPCPAGQFCDNGFCLVDPCYMVDCPPVGGEAQTCDDGDCVASCSLSNCDSGDVCDPFDGVCKEDSCVGFPDRCTEGQFCLAGVCEIDACFEIDCPAEQYCLEGSCVDSCAGVECPNKQSCELGVCVEDLCEGIDCGVGGTCNPEDGECQQNLCINVQCSFGEVCNEVTGECEADPCNGVECPDEQFCREGSCFSTDTAGPEDEDKDYVSVGGGGGCQVGGGAAGGLIGVFFALLMMLGFRRREEN